MENRDFGFIRAGAVSMEPSGASPKENARRILAITRKAAKKGIQLLVFPQLSLAGRSPGEILSDGIFLEECLDALKLVSEKTKNMKMVLAVGMPFAVGGEIFDCAAIIVDGIPAALVPRTYMSPSRGIFSPGTNLPCETVGLCGYKIPFGKTLVHLEDRDLTLGVETGADLLAVTPPSCRMALEGAGIILNLSANLEDSEKELAIHQSARCICGYVHSSFDGSLIAENGKELTGGSLFSNEGSINYADIDVSGIFHERKTSAGYYRCEPPGVGQIPYGRNKIKSRILSPDFSAELAREIPKNPFFPSDKEELEEITGEIMNIQAAGLAKRIEHTGIKRVVIGVSGGVDSTLALLVACKTFDMLGIPRKNIIGVGMPGFGTTDSTYNNALSLMKVCRATYIEIDIKEACMVHFRDIGHDPQERDVTYENVQARERTQILMDIANKENALVIGTGDLSETALGWCTYNGDHMSMYAVNSSVPKTLIRHLIKSTGETMGQEMEKILADIIDTPVSPELLPPGEKGEITQKTESILGPYELHDFFLYSFVKNKNSPDKILFLASKAFEDVYNEEKIRRTLEIFLSRFISQQFKRSCMPDGPKTGPVSLSPRSDWKMPSDASPSLWKV